MTTPPLPRTVALTQAEIGLIYTLALQDLQESHRRGDDGAFVYEVVPTGQKATTEELLEKFARLVTGAPPELTAVEHRERHQMLHRALDELLADFIDQTEAPVLARPIEDLIKWSHRQTIQPTVKAKGANNGNR
jgi:hypothetical protein